MTKLSLCLFSLAPALLAATPEPPVKPDSGDTIQLCGDCATPRTVRIAVSGSKPFIPKRDEQPQVVEAALDNVRDVDLASKFAASWVLGGKQAIGIEIKVDKDLHRKGTYTLILALQPKSQPRLPRLALKIVQPAAQIDIRPTSLKLYRGWVNPDHPKLLIQETSGDAAVTLDDAQEWDSTEGKVELPGPLPEIGAKKSAELDYKLADIPPGKVTKTVRFRAPQLAAPATATIEVETLWPRLYLWLAIVIGLGVGYLAKTKLRDQIELGQARQQADELLAEAGSERDRIHDATYRHTIDPFITHLRQARDERVAATIRERHGALAGALKDAATNLTQRLQDQQKRLDELRGVLAPDWRLPVTLTARLAVHRANLAGVQERFSHSDADGARARIDAIRNEIVADIQQAYQDWPEVRGSILRMSEAAAGVPESAVTQLAAAIESAPEGWRDIRPLANQADFAAITATLEDYQTKFKFVASILESWVRRLEGEWAEIEKQLMNAKNRLPNRPAFNRLHQDWEAFMATLRVEPQGPNGPLHVTAQQLTDLQQSWSDGMGGQFPGDNALTELIAHQQFAQAAARLRALLTVAGALGGLAPPGTIGWQSLGGQPMGQYWLIPPSPIFPSWLPSIKAFQASPVDMIRRAQIAQTVIVALVLTLLLLSGVLSTNTGDWGDLVHAFTVAFGADVALDALLTRINGKA